MENQNNAVIPASEVQPSTVTEPVIVGGMPSNDITAHQETPQVPVTPAQEPSQDAEAHETPPPQVSTPEELQAATERLKQQNSRNAKLLSSLGLDPMSDIAEQMEQGLVTPDMVYQHISHKFGPLPNQQAPVQQPNQPVDAVSVATQTLADLKAQYNTEAESGGVSLETNGKLLDAIQNLNDVKLDAVTSQIAARDQAGQVNQNLEAVLSVARTGADYASMDPALQDTVNRATISMTGLIADNEAQRYGIDPARLTPQQYTYFATKAHEQLGELREHFINVGRNQVKDGLRPQNQGNNIPVVPAGPSGNPVIPVNPYAHTTVDNHEELARQFAANNVQV